MLQLRDYQRGAIDAVYAYWREKDGWPLVVLPTGAGKSLVLATFIRELLESWPDMRILCVTHVKELLEQNYAELLGIWPFAPAGLFSAGLGRRDAHAQIIFGGVQTIAKQTKRIGHIDLVLVDEAHLVPRDATTQYGVLFAGLRAINPDLKGAGLTATDFRLGEGRLTDPVEVRRDGVVEIIPPMFDEVVFEKPVAEMIDEGYLARPITKATATTYDLKGVGKSGGDYKQAALEAAVDRDEVTEAAVDEVVAYGAARRAWLLFCSGVQHAYHVRDALRSRGITAETVAGETPAPERARILADFKAGRVRAVTNNSVLTTGFNHPAVDLLAMMRPTLSTALYVQMVGRGLRNAPGKDNCLVLDFARNIGEHGPIDQLRIRTPGKGDGEPMEKECPECHSLVHLSKMVCDDCGYEFERKAEDKITRTAADAPILASAPPETRGVTGRWFRRHEKVGGLPSVRADFLCGGTAFKSWICPQHTGFAKAKSDRFWKEHGGSVPFPANVDEFLDRQAELKTTAEITVRPNGRYWDVLAMKAGDFPSPANDDIPLHLDDVIPF